MYCFVLHGGGGNDESLRLSATESRIREAVLSARGVKGVLILTLASLARLR